MEKKPDEIKIGGRSIPLMLSTLEMADIQEEIGCTVGQLRDEVFGLQVDMETDKVTFGIVEDGKKIRKFAKLIRILGNAGLEETGQAPDLTDKWILRNMKPGLLMAYVVGVTAIINAAMQIETGKKQEGPVDEVLEEENRKKEPET
jgi:hypothetical protein